MLTKWFRSIRYLAQRLAGRAKTAAPTPVLAEPDEVWAAVGNIKDPCMVGPNGGKPERGTAHLRAGAKVYVIDAFGGMLNGVTVIAQHRRSRRFICIVVRPRHIQNLRPKRIYSPTVLQIARQHFADRPLPTKADAERFCLMSEWPH